MKSVPHLVYSSHPTMTFRFEDLTIWHQARRFSSSVHAVTAKFPRVEQYGLAGQMNRASDAVALLIAEGSGLPTRPRIAHRAGLALGETCETTAGLFLALDRAYITQDELERLYEDARAMSASLSAFRRQLRLTTRR